jgi:hypothetical protein
LVLAILAKPWRNFSSVNKDASIHTEDETSSGNVFVSSPL